MGFPTSALFPLAYPIQGPQLQGNNDGDTLIWDAVKKMWKYGPGGSGGASNTDDLVNLSSVPGANGTAALNYLLAALGLAGLKQAPLLGDVNSTMSLTAGSLYVLNTPITANRSYTINRLGLPGNTPGTQSEMYFLCLDTSAFTKTIVNGGAGAGNPMVVAAGASPALYGFIDDGTNWVLTGQKLVQTV